MQAMALQASIVVLITESLESVAEEMSPAFLWFYIPWLDLVLLQSLYNWKGPLCVQEATPRKPETTLY